MGGLVVKPRARIYHGHDWVFSGEVLKAFGKPEEIIYNENVRRVYLGEHFRL